MTTEEATKIPKEKERTGDWHNAGRRRGIYDQLLQ